MIPVIAIFISVTLLTIFLIPSVKTRNKGLIAFSAVVVNALLSGYLSIQGLNGLTSQVVLSGNLVFGDVPIVLDALSGWFILIINLTFITGGYYGLFYMKAYQERHRNLDLHAVAFIVQHATMLGACVIQNSLVFLINWELLTIASFLLIIFERENMVTIKAGINYLIQSHFSMVFLMLGFIWVASQTGSYDMRDIALMSSSVSRNISIALFLCFFIGFGFKAGFVPFHTWLPYAHPAAPSHVSGIMSGVIIKAGIYGILRILLLIRTDFQTVGYFILVVSVISGLYGVMLAIVQHNLKRLLAYHSIENIGIIGIGIGIGCIGLGKGNEVMVFLGFAGALLHTLNHALFKSLLFYAAGNVYQAVHTMNIERLGGLIKKMPQTATLFLIAALAITGLPPFNGFISEFIIYLGIYNWIGNASLAPLMAAIMSMVGLVLIGGLAMMCFTKAFGIVFLGTERHILPVHCKEVGFSQLLPLYLLAAVIVLIGIFPSAFMQMLKSPVSLFAGTGSLQYNPSSQPIFETIQHLTRAVWGVILFALLIFLLRKLLAGERKIEIQETWGCGYIAPTPKQQYTASSFIRTYSKLFGVFLLADKDVQEVEGIFPKGGRFLTHPYDKIEKWLIDKPLKFNQNFMGRFTFLHNGRLQVYILYGIIFILAVIVLPLLYNSFSFVSQFLKDL
jgi:hydrogenase-4 component B